MCVSYNTGYSYVRHGAPSQEAAPGITEALRRFVITLFVELLDFLSREITGISESLLNLLFCRDVYEVSPVLL